MSAPGLYYKIKRWGLAAANRQIKTLPEASNGLTVIANSLARAKAEIRNPHAAEKQLFDFIEKQTAAESKARKTLANAHEAILGIWRETSAVYEPGGKVRGAPAPIVHKSQAPNACPLPSRPLAQIAKPRPDLAQAAACTPHEQVAAAFKAQAEAKAAPIAALRARMPDLSHLRGTARVRAQWEWERGQLSSK